MSDEPLDSAAVFTPAASTTAQATAADAERVKHMLLATIRHDLRTPINAILGYGEMLLEDEEARESPSALAPDLRRIRAAGVELLERVNQVLDPSRLEATESIDLEHFGATLRRDLRTPINAIIGYGEMLLEDAATAQREDVVPDLQKICQAAARFLSLIDDVVTFSAATHAVAGTTLSPGLQVEGAEAAVLVQDAITTIRNLEGTAAGVAAMHGKVHIVDDNDINRDVLSRHLERQGHVVTGLSNGRAALELVHVQSFDLVLLDIMMPEVNGYDVLQQIKADPATRDIPVIMISALDELDAVVHCIEMGAEDYLAKPFNQTLLRARIGACLEKKRLRDQEKEYLRHVAELTTAAAAVENNTFEPQNLVEAARRKDALGQLARVFQRMATEIYSREMRLKEEVQQLRIEIDQVKMAHQVAEITDTDFFQDLQRKARQLRPDRSSDR
jgi:DNA-binding response OmpR family regulator